MLLKKATVFFLTFFAYVALSAMRSGWSYSKAQLEQQFGIERSYFGIVDATYLVCYSIGMATIVNLSKFIPLNIFIGLGMIIASLFYISFPIYYQITGVFNLVATAILMCFNGFFQSAGWPGVMGIWGNWFGKGKKGVLMAIWTINSNLGSIIAQLLCNLLQQNFHLSWTYNFIVNGAITMLVALLVIFFIQQKPPKQPAQIHPLPQTQQNLRQPILREENKQQLDHKGKQQINKQQKSQYLTKNYNVFTAIFLPGVPYYVIGYSCVKGCAYGILFWLPLYLDQKNLDQQKGYISAMFGVGSFVGGLILGYLGDRYNLRALFLTPLLLISSAIMFSISFFLTDVAWTYYLIITVLGVTCGGPYNLIGSTITIDLGQQAGSHNVAPVSALIEGSSSIFAAGSQMIISIMPYDTIFYLFSGECALSALSLIPMFLKDFSELQKRRKSKSMNQ